MAFPAILRRLFANNGAGPLLRADILPAMTVDIDYLFIGAPLSVATTTLPAKCMWGDGSLALFADWPQFAAKYRAGGFAGMVDNSSNSTNLGKFVLHSSGTGLYLPRLGGQFLRGWTPGGGTAGAWTPDTGRNVTGGMGHIEYVVNTLSGAFYSASSTPGIRSPDYGSGMPSIGFSAERVWGASHTGPQFKPTSVDIPIAIYMGNHA